MSFASILGTLSNLSNGTQVSDISTNIIDNNPNNVTGKRLNEDNLKPYNSDNTDNENKDDNNYSSKSGISNKGNLIFSVPNWGYKDYIYERTSWQKGFDSIASDPGWFYFKIFFKFQTDHGLFADILQNPYTEDFGSKKDSSKNSLFPKDNAQEGSLKDSSKNSALSKDNAQEDYLNNNFFDNVKKQGNNDTAFKYLYNMMNINHRNNDDSSSPYKDRLISLSKFVKTLHYINSRAPWFFKGINGLDQVFMVENMNNPMSSDRKIELVMREDAVDTRVSTLFELYKYAAYDYINMKEILPENLRQFDMIVVLFHTPLKYWHTGIQTMRRGTFDYKDLYSDNADQRMTYKMFTFHGCEFIPSSLNSIYPSNITNDEPFQLAKDAAISIKFKRVYQHTFNEWGRFMIGDDGVYVLGKDGTTTYRQKAISDAYENPYYSNPSADVFKAIVDASEQKITYAMRMIDPSTVFGNLYYDYTDTKGKYFKDKIKNLKQGSKELNKGVR